MDAKMLGTISFLSGLSPEELEILGNKFSAQDVQAGVRIVEEGQPIHSLYVVSRGLVHVRRASQDREVMVARIGPGGFFGEMNLFEHGKAAASVYAMEHSTLGVADHEALRACMSENPAMGYKIVSAIMTVMCRRLRDTNDRLLSAYFWTGAVHVESEDSQPTMARLRTAPQR